MQRMFFENMVTGSQLNALSPIRWRDGSVVGLLLLAAQGKVAGDRHEERDKLLQFAHHLGCAELGHLDNVASDVSFRNVVVPEHLLPRIQIFFDIRQRINSIFGTDAVRQEPVAPLVVADDNEDDSSPFDHGSLLLVSAPTDRTIYHKLAILSILCPRQHQITTLSHSSTLDLIGLNNFMTTSQKNILRIFGILHLIPGLFSIALGLFMFLFTLESSHSILEIFYSFIIMIVSGILPVQGYFLLKGQSESILLSKIITLPIVWLLLKIFWSPGFEIGVTITYLPFLIIPIITMVYLISEKPFSSNTH